MSSDLNGKTIAFLATDGVERVELQTPRDAIIAAGGSVVLLTIDDLSVSLWDDDEDRAGTERADRLVGGADIDDYDALVLPGGVRNPDKLRIDADAVAFARAFVESGRPVAAICHGPWLLAEADVVRGRKLTSFPSLQTDLRNAGAVWVDEEVVNDRGLITSRNPDDLDAFSSAVLEAVAG